VEVFHTVDQHDEESVSGEPGGVCVCACVSRGDPWRITTSRAEFDIDRWISAAQTVPIDCQQDRHHS